VKKILWQLLNNVITIIAALVAYWATNEIGWAVAIAAPVRAIAELATRLINDYLIN
jgi:hypothetical protein